MSVVMEAHDGEPSGFLPRCRHLACSRPSTSTTVLTGYGRRWELTYCDEHRDDGVQVGCALGFSVVPPPPPRSAQRSATSHLSVVSRDPVR